AAAPSRTRTRRKSGWRWIPISSPSWSPDRRRIARLPMKTNLPKLAVLLLVGSCVAALAQADRPGAAQAQSSAVALPAHANVVGSGPIVAPPVPRPSGNAANRPRGDFTIHSRHLLYVTLPGSL